MELPVAISAALEVASDAHDGLVAALAAGAAGCVVLAYAADVRADVLAVAKDTWSSPSLALLAIGAAQAAIAVVLRRYSGTLLPFADSASR